MTELLEQRPAVLVERFFIELRFIADSQHHAVGFFGCHIGLAEEQDLAAAKLCFVYVVGVRMLSHQAIKHFQCPFRLPIVFVCACQLIHHTIILCVLRIGHQQLLVEQHSFFVLCGHGLAQAFHLLIFSRFELQVGEAAHGFSAQCGIVDRELEEGPIAFHRLLRTLIDRYIAVDFDFMPLEIADGRVGVIRVLRLIAAKRPQPCKQHRVQDRQLHGEVSCTEARS